MADEQDVAIFAPSNLMSSRVRRSLSTAKLDEALAKAVLEFDEVKKENENPFFKSKYADLSAVLSATRSQLAKHGITLRQWPYSEQGRVGITSRICCQGEWEESDYDLPLSGKQDAQAVGSAITYARRYATQSILCVAAELDDDANSVSVAKVHEAEARADVREADAQAHLSARIAPFQVKELDRLWHKNAWTEKQVTAWLQAMDGSYVQLEDISKADFNEAFRVFSKAPPVPEDLEKALQASLPINSKPTAKPVPAKKPNRFAKIYAIAGKKRIPDSDIHQQVKESYGKVHMSDLTNDEIAGIEGWLDSLPAS